MPPTSTDLDIFILALVRRGCATPYELKLKCGISIGSSVPVLERLAKARLLSKRKPGVAPASEFSTRLGKQKLESGWQEHLADRPTDPDAILRIAYLVWALGRRDALMKFIQAAAETLWDAAGSRMQAANEDRYLDLLNVGFLLGRPPYEISWLAEVGFIPAHALRHEGRRIGSSGSVRCGRGPRRSALSRPFNRRNLLNRQLKPTCRSSA